MSHIGTITNALYFDPDDIPENIAQLLYDKLPHGSGIDEDWTLEHAYFDIIHAHNAYHSMNEMGSYCHWWEFYVVVPIKYNDDDSEIIGIDRENKYLGDVTFVNCNPENDCPTKQDILNYLAELSKEELLNFNGNDMNLGCGYNLKEYLEETIYSALTE